MRNKEGYQVALVGTDSLRGKEMKNVLNESRMPIDSMDFYEPEVEEEFGKLTQFRGEPKVIRHLKQDSLLPYQLVFLASTHSVNRKCGDMVAGHDVWAIDLAETFNRDEEVPIVVAGVNDAVLFEAKPGLIANPHPVTIILSHMLHLIRSREDLEEGAAFVLQPVSAFDNSGIEELASQCYDVLQGASIKKKVFKTQIAFNLLSRIDSSGEREFSQLEEEIVSEIKKVLADPFLPLSLAVIQAPVFFTYSIMIRFRLKVKVTLRGLEDLFKTSSYFESLSSKSTRSISSVSVAGKDRIHIGRIKIESSFPNVFWIWAVADNLTRGSALNAYEIAEEVLLLSPRKK